MGIKVQCPVTILGSMSQVSFSLLVTALLLMTIGMCAGAVFFAMPLSFPGKRDLIKLLGKSRVLYHAVTALLVVFTLLSLYAAPRFLQLLVSPALVLMHPLHSFRFCTVTLFALLNTLGLFLLQKAAYLLHNDPEGVLSLEQSSDLARVVRWAPPPKTFIKAVVAPMSTLLTPKTFGIEHIPRGDQRLLFVCNHALAGMEMPLFVSEVFCRADVFPRGLGDHFHFMVPGWAQFLESFGAVDGRREVCSALMQAGQPILVYPGGAHEVLKRKTDKRYGLKWKERAGFARLAIQHGYTIIPCASVGTEDMLEILADIPLGVLRNELTLPLIRPPTPSELQRIYFWFGEPIDTRALQGQEGDKDVVWRLREDTRKAVEDGIAFLLDTQANDPQRHVLDSIGKDIRAAQKRLCSQFWETLSKVSPSPTSQGEQEGADGPATNE